LLPNEPPSSPQKGEDKKEERGDVAKVGGIFHPAFSKKRVFFCISSRNYDGNWYLGFFFRLSWSISM